MLHCSNDVVQDYSWLSLSRPRLSRITAYLEVKIWSLPIHENLTTDGKYCRKEEKLLLRSNFPLFHNIFNRSLTSKVQLPISLLNVVNQIIFSSILQTWYVELRISRSISESPLEFEITRVDCIYWYEGHSFSQNCFNSFYDKFVIFWPAWSKWFLVIYPLLRYNE